MPSTMQAVVKAHAAPGIEVREVPVPTPGPGEVLVRVQAASVCGTDLHIFNWDPWAQGRIHPPLIPGHEFAGVVAGIGRGVTTVKEGDKVPVVVKEIDEKGRINLSIKQANPTFFTQKPETPRPPRPFSDRPPRRDFGGRR